MNINIEELPCWLEDNGVLIRPVLEREIFWEGDPTTLYYVCSRNQQHFSVTVDCQTYLRRICTLEYPNIHAELFLDGIRVSALVTDVSLNETVLRFEGVHLGDADIRPFQFENLNTSEDGRTPNQNVMRNLGNIKVALRRAKLGKVTRSKDKVLSKLHQGSYDETKVKMRLAHVSDLGDKRAVNAEDVETETWTLDFHPQEETRPFHCFLFKYNSENVWRASGIIQRRRRGQPIDLPGSRKNPIVL